MICAYVNSYYVNGKTDLVFIETNLNSRRHIAEVLTPFVIPYVRICGQDFILMDDNA